MNTIHIKNGRIIDPANNIDHQGSLYIADGKILSIDQQPAGFTADQEINADQQIVCPGFIDLSVRLREPGQSYKATINSETYAAAAAGVTSLCIPPDTKPVIDTQAVTELITEKAAQASYPQVYPIGALTRQLAGQELSSMAALKEAGCIAVSNATSAISSLRVLRRAMEYANSHNLLVIYQPDTPSLSDNGCVHEGYFSTRHGLPGIPDAAESIAVAQCLELTELTGARVHFSQISCSRSITRIQEAKLQGLKVTCDTAIHQLHLTENDIEPFNSVYHVLPPFRTEDDKQHLQASLAEGIIDSICSNHQPHDLDAKLGAFPETEPGISALETLLPLTLQLVDQGAITLPQAIAALTQQPAKILNIKAGALTPGYAADVCIFDPELYWQVDENNWHSNGKNTPFWGQSLKGRVTQTLQSGKVIYKYPGS